jgi:hypothetical protein
VRFSQTFELTEPATAPRNSGPASEEATNAPLRLPRAPAGLTVDGRLAEWPEQMKLGPVTLDPGNAEEVARRAGWFWLAWDEQNLYVAAQVNSPTPLYNTARQGRNQWYFFDSIQVRVFFPGVQVTHWGFYQDLKTGQDFVPIAWGLPTGHENLGENPPGARLVMLKTADGKGYTMEAALPWSLMAPNQSVKPGVSFHVAVQFNWCNPNRDERYWPDSQMYFRGNMNWRNPQDWTMAELAE